MAIALIGAPLAGVRGTFGGITFSANKAGPYIKAWAKPPNPRTGRQTIERGFLGRMPGLWRALTGVQQTAWDTFAALGAQDLTNSLGQTYHLSGFGWFCKCNIRLLRVGRSTIAAVPTQARPAAPTIEDFRVCVAGTDADLCVGGAVSASSEIPAFPAVDAFDDDAGTFWSSQIPMGDQWLQYVFTSAVNIKRYTVQARDSVPANSPRDWTFEVYTGGGWEVLQTVTDVPFAVGQKREFFCANPYTEDTYRIYVTDNNGGANYVQIAEMEMMSGDEGQSVIVYPEDEFEDTPDWDLVLHVSMGNSVGMQVQYPGFYEMLALEAPGRWYELFQTAVETVFGTILENRSWFGRLARQTAEGLRSSWATQRGVTLS